MISTSVILKKDRVLKDPTDYRPASNSYPSQIVRREDDALGPSELVERGLQSYLTNPN